LRAARQVRALDTPAEHAACGDAMLRKQLAQLQQQCAREGAQQLLLQMLRACASAQRSSDRS
jgi:hypothetical protein